MKLFEFIEAGALLKRVFDRYDRNPENAVCDLLALISRAATISGVRLQPMLDAVRKGARLPNG